MCMCKSSVRKTSVAVGVFVGATLSFSGRAAGYSCAEVTVEQKATEADTVFLGEVEFTGLTIKVWDPGPVGLQRRVNFRVIEAWKGLTGTQVGMTTSVWGPSWGVAAVVAGKQALIYGNAFEGELFVGPCSIVSDPLSIQVERAELKQLGYEPLALMDGPDSQWPPYSTAPCGLGVLPSVFMTAIGIACLRIACPSGERA